jgi:3-hydroxymyristoyl/3-hydroxydecanoyl-(acyl carrier protein) dehydratase
MTVGPQEPRRLELSEHSVNSDSEGENHQIKIRVPSDLLWFQGHFPGDPVLPAVVQLHEALMLARKIWPDLVRLRTVARAKFQSPIRPADALTMHLRRSSGSGAIGFRYVRASQVCSSGILDFESSGPG